MAGTRGPIGKRSDERQRTNKPDIEVVKIDVADLIKADVFIPEADESWHPIARRWYASLAESAQCVYFEPSDWAIAYVTAESLSRDMKDQFLGISEETGEPIMGKIPLKGASLSAYTKIFNSLMMTEGDRRRLEIEVSRSSHIKVDENAATKVDIVKSRREAIGG